MRAQPGQLERSLAALTIGARQGERFRERVLADFHTGEWEQQIQVDIAGTAGSQPGFTDEPVSFQMPFLYAPAQRLVPFDRPHFTYGFELLNPQSTLVRFDAHVISWDHADNNWIIGATVRIAVDAPTATVTAVPYTAKAHLAFQGYGSFAEGGEFAP